MISEEKIAEVRERVDIAALIGKKVELKRAGRSLIGLCPFHNERTPSFNVVPERGFYHCFGCQASGDVFKFVMETEQRPFWMVVKELAKEVGVEIQEQEELPEEKKAREKRDWLYRVNDYVNEYFVHTLWSTREAAGARAYLEERKLTEETARVFSVGYAPRRADDLLAYLGHKKVPKEAAIELGVLGERDDGSHYLRFFDRVMFPIHDDRDRIAGFGGRVLDPDAKAAKYLNSPESAIFKKSRLLYGFTKAKHAIARKGTAWLVEGYFDVIALHQAGLEQAVAPLGTALGPDHVPLLRRVAQRCLTMFDGDAAGLRATRKTTELLLAHGFGVNVLELPAGDDPDTLVLRLGSDVVQRLAGDAPAAVQFFIEQTARAMKPSVEGRVQAAQEIAPLLGKVTSQLERDLYVREAARHLGIDEDLLRRCFHPVRAVTPPAQVAARAAVRDKWQALVQPAEALVVSTASAITTKPVAPEPAEWQAVLEILKYRAAWGCLAQLEPLLEHEGLRRIVRQCIEDDAELTFEEMTERLGSAALARNLAAVLCEDLSPSLEPGQLERMMADVLLDVEHQIKKRELWLVTQALATESAAKKDTGASNSGAEGPGDSVLVELLRKKRELNQWIKRERPRRRESPMVPKR